MKVKVISRNEKEYTRDTKSDVFRIARNYNPALHPFEHAREYTRALNATKLERVFAKPFVGALSGHSDGIYSMAKHTKKLNSVISGSCDGEIRVWNLSNQETRWSINAHEGFVRGIAVDGLGETFVSVGDDKIIKQWKLDSDDYAEDEDKTEPIQSIIGKNVFTGIDHHRKQELFATSGSTVDIWDHNRSEPVNSFDWGLDTITSVKFNPVEVNILASTASDRNICLYDIRGGSALRKVVLSMRSNALAWNPREAFNFTVANEDHNLYTFDMRKLDRALNVHKDHVSAVMDVDYSPTGREFVSGSYDRSVRIFRANEGHSREIYHTKRMQRIFKVLVSADAKYLLSGSDETNIRLWKMDAAEKLGTKSARERSHLEYQEALKEKFKYHPEVKRIARHRHLPKSIYKAAEAKRNILGAAKVREENKRKHSKPGAVPYKKQRSKSIVNVQK